MDIKYRKFQAHTSVFNLSNVESLKKLGKTWKDIFPDWKVFYYISASIYNPNKISTFYYPLEEEMHILVIDEYSEYSNHGSGTLLCTSPVYKIEEEPHRIKLTCNWNMKFRHEKMLPYGNEQNVITMEIPTFYFDDPDFELQFGSFTKKIAQAFKVNLLFDIDERPFHELDYGLPQLGQWTIFGEPYLESIGEKVLLTTPAINVEKFDDFILIETGGTLEESQKAAKHLGMTNFFREVKQHHIYRPVHRQDGGCLFMLWTVTCYFITRPLQYFLDMYGKFRHKEARASNIPIFDWSGIQFDLPRNITEREKIELLESYRPAFTPSVYLTLFLIILATAGSYSIWGFKSFFTIVLIASAVIIPICKYILTRRRNYTTCMIFKESGLDIHEERKKWLRS